MWSKEGIPLNSLPCLTTIAVAKVSTDMVLTWAIVIFKRDIKWVLFFRITELLIKFVKVLCVFSAALMMCVLCSVV